MKNFIAFGFCAVMVTACVEAGPNFERMTELELAAYNNDRPISQMIVCTDEARTFSRVRRRHCGTVESLYGSEAQVNQLEVQHLGSDL